MSKWTKNRIALNEYRWVHHQWCSRLDTHTHTQTRPPRQDTPTASGLPAFEIEIVRMKDNHHRLHDKPQFWKRNFEKNTIVCVCVCVWVVANDFRRKNLLRHGQTRRNRPGFFFKKKTERNRIFLFLFARHSLSLSFSVCVCVPLANKKLHQNQGLCY